MGILDDIKTLAQLEEKAKALREFISFEQTLCQHEWGEAVYCPEPTKVWVYDHLEGHGSDPIAVGNYVDGPSTPKWKRTCRKCGLVQTTLNQKIHQSPTYTPDFDNRR